MQVLQCECFGSSECNCRNNGLALSVRWFELTPYALSFRITVNPPADRRSRLPVLLKNKSHLEMLLFGGQNYGHLPQNDPCHQAQGITFHV